MIHCKKANDDLTQACPNKEKRNYNNHFSESFFCVFCLVLFVYTICLRRNDDKFNNRLFNNKFPIFSYHHYIKW